MGTSTIKSNSCLEPMNSNFLNTSFTEKISMDSSKPPSLQQKIVVAVNLLTLRKSANFKVQYRRYKGYMLHVNVLRL